MSIKYTAYITPRGEGEVEQNTFGMHIVVEKLWFKGMVSILQSCVVAIGNSINGFVSHSSLVSSSGQMGRSMIDPIVTL